MLTHVPLSAGIQLNQGVIDGPLLIGFSQFFSQLRMVALVLLGEFDFKLLVSPLFLLQESLLWRFSRDRLLMRSHFVLFTPPPSLRAVTLILCDKSILIHDASLMVIDHCL